MAKDDDFKLLKIQTCVLRVNIHCDGCKHKVKKILQRIEGVFQVKIETEQQKVTVSGSVDSGTLVKKLIRAGKHAEVWSNKASQNQNQKASCIKDDKNKKGQKQVTFKGIDSLKNQQQKFANLSISEDDDDYMDGEEEDEFNEDALRFYREKVADQMNFQRQQATNANNSRKIVGLVPNVGQNNGKMNNQGGKKGNQNQNMEMKGNAGGGLDPKFLAALKLNNAHLTGGNLIPGELNRGGGSHDVNSMMMRNFAGFQGNAGNNNNIAAAYGGNYQMQPNQTGPLNGVNYGTYPSSSVDTYSQQFNNPTSAAAMRMNMQNRQPMMQPQSQPQMMYQRSPIGPPSTTGYYCNYNPGPYPPYNEPVYYPTSNGVAADQSASPMFNDEYASSCSIM
ncbi:heavy metal-associated isoprenylated plant protein 37-like [Apium graveolens]|uniref:heavy metal-associated isoprenylated plant protein 37-like n=1 Tax=Apium graveolens TaxID=4045 RepID=UPI003D7ACA3F